MSEEKRPWMPPQIARIVAVAERLYVGAQTMLEREPCGDMDDGGAYLCGPNIKECLIEAEILVNVLDDWRISKTKEWEEWYKTEGEKLK